MSASLRYLFQLAGKLKPSIPRFSKRSFLIITSTAGVIALCASAIYMRRKKRKQPCLPPARSQDMNGEIRKKKHRKHRSSYNEFTPSHSRSSSRQMNRRYSRQNSSLSCSSAVSGASSVRSKRQLLKQMDQETVQKAHDLYLQGAGDIQHALDHWRQANSLISSTSSVNSSPRSTSRKEHARKRRKARNTSLSLSRDSIAEYDSTSQDEMSEKFEDDSTLKLPNTHTVEEIASFQGQVTDILEKIEHLEISFTETFAENSSSDTDITITGLNENEVTAFSDSDSAESFVSAHEVWDTISLSDHTELTIYQEALREVNRGHVKCRTFRTEMLQCYSDNEYLAKLYCVRLAFDAMLKDAYVRDWLIDSGKRLIEGILKSANRSVDSFCISFSQLIDYVSMESNWEDIEEELAGRKVVRMSFYDIVLDFIIMDSFDDLENPPSSVVSVLNNRWLSNSLKETALSTAVWSVLKAKAQMLRQPDGFISKFYAVSETISPLLAWGFMGPDEQLKTTCIKFRDEILSFLQSTFSFDQVHYTNPATMSTDILKLAKSRIHNMFAYFEALKNAA